MSASQPDRKVMAVLLMKALMLASQGFRIFPLIPGGKTPAIMDWPDRATTSPLVIRQWWSEREFNIGIACGRPKDGVGRYLVVIDYDCNEKRGKRGETTLRAHRLLGLTETMQVASPNGLHCYYWSEQRVPNSQSRVGEHVDVKGWHGYVVAPGSVVEGKEYVRLTDTRVAPVALPAELAELAAKPSDSEEEADNNVVVMALTPEMKARARERMQAWLINSAREAIEGSGGDNATVEVARHVRDHGVDEDDCFELMARYWNTEKAAPPWPLDEPGGRDLRTKVRNAYRYAKGAQGERNPEVEFDDVMKPEAERVKAGGAETGGEEEKKQEKSEKPLISATPFVLRDSRLIPQRQWLYGHHLVRKFGSATIALGAVGKSSMFIVEALALATGRDLIGVLPRQRARVWLWNGEDPMEELERRIAAACLHYAIKKEDIEGWLFVDSGRTSKIIIANETREGTVIAMPVVKALIATIQENKIDVMQIDPFVASHRVSENDNNAIDVVAKTWTQIADICNIGLDLAHHSRKTGGGEVTIEDGRGAIALVNAVRAARVLNTMTEEEAGRAGVAERFRHFKVANGKPNLTIRSEQADWFRMESVDLGNGTVAEMMEDSDQIGVVTGWTWPDPMLGVGAEDFAKAAVEIKAGRWREHHQANDWVGHAIGKALGLRSRHPADRTRIKGMIENWLSYGMLVEVVERDTKARRSKRFIEVGKDENVSPSASP